MTDPIARKKGRYAVEIGGKHTAPTVTGVLDLLSKPLHFGAAKETALFAFNHQDDWITLPEVEAVRRLQTHFSGVWKAKADIGSRVHAMAQRWAAGQEVDCEPTDEPYLDALERFYADYRPETLHVERSVFRADPETSFGGTFDWIVMIQTGLLGFENWLIDLKTGAEIWPEVDLQLSAYRFADAMGIYDPDTGEMSGAESMPTIDRSGVLHLRDDGTYGLVPVEAGPAQFETFLSLRRVWQWRHRNTKPITDTALEAPKKESAVV